MKISSILFLVAMLLVAEGVAPVAGTTNKPSIHTISVNAYSYGRTLLMRYVEDHPSHRSRRMLGRKEVPLIHVYAPSGDMVAAITDKVALQNLVHQFPPVKNNNDNWPDAVTSGGWPDLATAINLFNHFADNDVSSRGANEWTLIFVSGYDRESCHNLCKPFNAAAIRMAKRHPDTVRLLRVILTLPQ
jgi:hypothetical protein